MMDDIVKKFLTPSLFVFLFSTNLFAYHSPIYHDICLTPYVGADAVIRYNPFQNNFGGNVFEQYYPEGNAFFGVKFSDYLGAEVGYKTSVSKTRVVSLGTGETAVGIPVDNPPALHRAVASFKGWHVELVGFIPIYRKACASLLGSLGISRTKLFARDKIVQTFLPGFGVAPFPDNLEVSTFSRTKNILTIGMGIQIEIKEETYLRLKINWENTSRFKSVFAKENNGILKPKNSFMYSVGVVFNLF